MAQTLTVEVSATHVGRVIITLAEAGISEAGIKETGRTPIRKEGGVVLFARRFTISCQIAEEKIKELVEELDGVPAAIISTSP